MPGPFPAELGVTLGIGDTERVAIPLDEQLPSGPWDARIVLRSGLLERSAKAQITFPDHGSAPPVSASTGMPIRLYVGIAGVALVLIAVSALLTWLKRRGRRPLLAGPIR